jgi:hypothetical protein
MAGAYLGDLVKEGSSSEWGRVKCGCRSKLPRAEAEAASRRPSAQVPFDARPALTRTRGSVRLVHTAISSLMLMSG